MSIDANEKASQADEMTYSIFRAMGRFDQLSSRISGFHHAAID
jgi:hypothetical protein